MKKLWTVLMLAAVCMFAGLPLTASAAATIDLPIEVEEDYEKALEMIGLVNELRAGADKEPFVVDAYVMDVAMQRATELAICDDHERPDGTTTNQITDGMGGDIIACGYNQAADTFEKWRGSWTHRSAMLANSPVCCGAGCVLYEGTRYWTFVTAEKQFSSDSVSPRIQKNTRTLTVDTSKIQFYINDWNFPGFKVYSNSGVGMYYGSSASAGICIKNFYSDPGIGYRVPEYMIQCSSNTSDVIDITPNGVITPKKIGSASISVALKSYPSIKNDITFTVDTNISNIWQKKMTITPVGPTVYEYTGTSIEPKYVIKDMFENLLVEGVDYKITYSNNVEPGTGIATIYMLENYSDEGAETKYGTRTFTIKSPPEPETNPGGTGGGSTGSGTGGGSSTGGSAGTGGGTGTGGGGTGGTGAGEPVIGGSGGGAAVVSDGGSGGSAYTTLDPSLPKASAPSLKSTKKKTVTVKWKKKKGVSGYQIQYALNKKFTKSKKTKTAKAKKTSLTVNYS